MHHSSFINWGGGEGREWRTDTQLSGLQASMGAQGLISQKSLDKRLSLCLVGSKEYILPEVFENKVNNTLGHFHTVNICFTNYCWFCTNVEELSIIVLQEHILAWENIRLIKTPNKQTVMLLFCKQIEMLNIFFFKV